MTTQLSRSWVPPLTVNIVDAYVEILSKNRQIEVTLARAGTVRHE